MKSVTVVGLGYVGLPSAALIANAGYHVRGVDIDQTLIDQLSQGYCPLDESQVKAEVELALESKNLSVGTVAACADIFIVCVPTPIKNQAPDLSMVKSAMASIVPYIRKGNLVILESTSPIGTTRDIIGGALREAGLDPLHDVDVSYCPERVFPGDTVREILENDRVVGGLTPRAAQRAKDFYLSFCNGLPKVTTASAAEFSKLMENTYRDVNIALANVFARIGEEAGVDVMDVITMANQHPRVNVHLPGPGVGGHCIPVDPWFLIDAFPGVSGFLKSARHINDGQAAHIVARAEKSGLRPGAKVTLLGAAYRGDIDDARDAPTLLLMKALDERGYDYAIHDPYIGQLKTHAGEIVTVTDDLSQALSGAQAAFILTEHSDYKTLSPADFTPMSANLIVDTRRIIDALAFLESGFDVVSLGAPAIEALAQSRELIAAAQ